jgi:hypothetical protein
VAAWPDDFAAQDAANNSILWFMTLKAGEKKTIEFTYTITSPSDIPVYVETNER